MRNSSRVVVNTVAQYARTIINIVLGFITVRIILRTLGVGDYGIYTLVAGVVSMLTFVTGALSTTTQRYISYNKGHNDIFKLKKVFVNSFYIHFGIGLAVLLLFVAATPLLFNGFLNIPEQRNQAAIFVYVCVILMVFISFVSSTFRALCVAHENIVFNTIIDILDSFIKLILVLIMVRVPWDKLMYYGLTTLLIQSINFVVFLVYCSRKYQECVMPSTKYFSEAEVKDMISFAGWNIYSTGCWVGREQGVAILLNKMMGTAINAAYGIGFQLSSYANFLSTAIAAAIQPQIVRNEGAGERNKSLWLTCVSCKFSFFLTAFISIPCMFEIDSLLQLWLGDVPQYTSLFCIMALLVSMSNAITSSLGHINQAVGKIKMYSILTNTPKVITIIIAWAFLYMGCPLIWVAISYVVIEFFCTWIRIPYIHMTAQLDTEAFWNVVIQPEISPTLLCAITCWACYKCLDFKYDFVITFLLSFVVYGLAIYKIGLSQQEREILKGIVLRFVQYKK